MTGAKSKKRLSYQDKKALAGYAFILPWILGFLIFFLKPMIQSLMFSFQEVKMAPDGFAVKFVGLDNYHYMLFRDPNFVRHLTDTLGNVISQVPVITMFSLFIAVILNQKFRGRGLMRAIFFLPVIVTSGVVLVLLKDEVFSTTLNVTQNVYLFRTTGLFDVLVQAGVNSNIAGIFSNLVNQIFSLTWKSGVQILLFLSGLQTVPPSSYEAAKMEGASGWDTFWKISIPMISPMIILNIVYSIIDTFTEYGTEWTGNTVMSSIYRTGFKDLLFGYSSAMAWIYFILIGVVLGLVYRFIGRRAFYMVE